MKDDQRKTFAKQVGEIFRERDAGALDVVDGDGEQTAGRMVLEETDGLANDLGVDVVAQIGDGGVADVLDLRRAQIFGDGLDAEDHQQREEENRFDVVEAGGKEGIQVDDVIGERNLSERKSGTYDGRIENVVDRGLDHQRDEAFGRAPRSPAERCRRPAAERYGRT